MDKDKKKLEKKLDEFTEENEEECVGEKCEVKDNKKGEIVEKIQKKLIISDGRQLLREIIRD